MSILSYISDNHDELSNYIIAHRRYLHEHPELSLKEYNTASYIEAELDKLGLTHTRVGETGVCSTIKGTASSSEKKQHKVAIRADIDALPLTEADDRTYKSQTPGVMHACGHDAHGASLLGAAKILKECSDEFAGEISIFFQQAEEIGAGARQFVSGGYLDGVERILGIHTSSEVPAGSICIASGPNNASVDHFKIDISGHQAHVSKPNLGIDALYIASSIVVSAQALITRLFSPTDPILIGIGKLSAGTAYNIVAGAASIEGTIRAFSPESRKKAKEKLNALSENTASSYGGSCDIHWDDYAAPLINPKEICEEVYDTAKTIWSADHIVTERPLSLGGDDFADYQAVVPGVYAYLGTGNSTKPNTLLPAHDKGFDIEESTLIDASALYAQCAYTWLKNL